MKRQLITAILILICSTIFAQLPQWQWAKKAGGLEADHCLGIVSDSQGNAYITGSFNQTASFGSLQRVSYGEDDIFVAKLDSEGNWLWAVHSGSEYFDRAYGIALDNAGNVYITGYFYLTAAFGPLSLTASGQQADIFVAKLDSEGNWLWVVRAGGFYFDEGSDIAVNDTGIVITGDIGGDAAFGSQPITCQGQSDIFIAKLDSNGNWLWARDAGGLYQDYGYSVALDNAGNVYATGTFTDDANFGGTILSSLGYSDIYIAKLNSNGLLIAAFRAGGIGWDTGTDIAVDPAGNVYLTGYFYLSIAFGPFVMTSYGNTDAYVTKMNSGAIYQWAHQAGGVFDEAAAGITADNQGNTYIIGNFSGEAQFGLYNLASYGYFDAFITKVDTNGFLPWVFKAGGAGNEYGSEVSFTEPGNIYITGVFEESAVFGNDILISQGDYDIYVAKIFSSNTANQDPLTPPVNSSVLYDAYPNPASGGQTIFFKTEIAKGERGTLSIYNLRGQKVAEYTQKSGLNDISFDSKGLAPGVYLYQLQTNTDRQVKKLSVIK